MGKTTDLTGSFLKFAGTALMVSAVGLLALHGGPALMAGSFKSFLGEAFLAASAGALGYGMYKTPELAPSPAK